MAHNKRPLIISLRPQSDNISYSPQSNHESASFLQVPNQQSVHEACSPDLSLFEYSSDGSFDSDHDVPLSCKRKFALKWKLLFPFIEYDDVKRVMYCRVCKQYASKSQKRIRFVIGTDNFRRTSIEYHERSALHIKCVEMSKTAACEGVEFYDHDKKKLSLVFNLVYFSIKAKSPYSYFPVLCDAQRKEGVDLGSAYTSHQGVVPLFSHYISCDLENALTNKLSSVKKFSLILDHAFSRTSESHELVYLKYLKEDMYETVFIGVIDSSKSSSHLLNSLDKLFLQYDMKNWRENVVYVYIDTIESCSFSVCDVISYFKEKSFKNFVSVVNILPHKVAQPNEILKKYQFINDFAVIICDIFQYCDKLTVFRKCLPNISKAIVEIENKYGCLPKIPFFYLNFQNLGAILEDFILLVSLLKEENNSIICMKVKLRGAKILVNVTSNRFIWELALILDLLSCLNEFAFSIQSQQLVPFTLHEEIHKLCSRIHISVEGNSSKVLFCKKEMSKSGSSLSNLFDHSTDISEIIAEMKKVGSSLTDSIRSSFPFLSILEHVQILDTRYWPNEDGLTIFGINEFTNLYHNLQGNEQNLCQALEEWRILKSNANLCFTADSLKNPNLAIRNMINIFDLQLPLVTSLLETVLLLNFSSSELERGYREINGLKSNDRSTLSIRSLQSSMMILIHGPSLSEFNPIPAMRLWLGQGKRRYRSRKKRKMTFDT